MTDRAGPRVAVVGGGLAGLAAACALAEHGVAVELFEARRALGGRAASFRDPATDELVDHCQHVSMGCCTNLRDFCRRTGIEPLFRRDRRLHFFTPEGRRYDLAATPGLPAPLHLAWGFLRLGIVSLADRVRIVRGLLRLARLRPDDDRQTVQQWLHDQRQSPAAIERFWSAVLVSALGESIERASLAQARKVFVDGFLAATGAYEIEVPRVALGDLYGPRLTQWFAAHAVPLHLATPVDQIAWDGQRVTGIALGEGQAQPFDAVVLAVAWRRVAELLPENLLDRLQLQPVLERLEASPITGIHLWFDRPITDLPHAVLVGTVAQWMFNRADDAQLAGQGEHYYQVVVSASRDLAAQERQTVVDRVVAELRRIWPAAGNARLLRWRVVTEQSAVFSAQPGLDALRPDQATSVENLFLAGDWTRTGWPSTMEGAVRSGYLAAERLLGSIRRPAPVLVPDLPMSWLCRRLTATGTR